MPAAQPIATYVVGVTGGIGSGKSTVCDLFTARHQVPVIDADIVAREVVAPGEPALDSLVELFGRGILAADGTLDRRQLKRIVFADETRRRALEDVLHPRIRERMHEAVAAITAPYCLLCVPLLIEGGRNPLVDRVLVVDCPEEVQIARVSQRDDLTADEVMAIMRAQATREQRCAAADDIVINDGNRADLLARVDELHETYLELARAHAPGSAHAGS